jgi:hypothetical protein
MFTYEIYYVIKHEGACQTKFLAPIEHGSLQFGSSNMIKQDIPKNKETVTTLYLFRDQYTCSG